MVVKVVQPCQHKDKCDDESQIGVAASSPDSVDIKEETCETSSLLPEYSSAPHNMSICGPPSILEPFKTGKNTSITALVSHPVFSYSFAIWFAISELPEEKFSFSK